MLLYHGTTKDFDKFIISENLLATKLENLVEGIGIYFTEKHEFAKSYGNIIYTVELENKDCWDFTKKETMKYFISNLEKKVNFPISHYISQNALEGIVDGDFSIRRFSREISLELDSTESFYIEIGDRDPEELFEKISEEYNKLLYSKKFFKYFDKGFNCCVYLCTNQAETLTILKKERND